MQEQGVEIGGEEPGVRKQRPQGLQHEQLVVEIRADDPDRPDAALALTLQLRIQVLDALAETPQKAQEPAVLAVALASWAVGSVALLFSSRTCFEEHQDVSHSCGNPSGCGVGYQAQTQRLTTSRKITADGPCSDPVE